MRFFYSLAATAAAFALTGCVATATIGAPTTPTPAALPTPSPPQVIYVQPPAAAPQPQPAGVDLVLVVVIVMAMTAGAIVAACITYIMGMRDGSQSATTRNASYFAGMMQVTPQERQALLEWRQRQQLTQANREVIHVRR